LKIIIFFPDLFEILALEIIINIWIGGLFDPPQKGGFCSFHNGWHRFHQRIGWTGISLHKYLRRYERIY